MIGGDVSHRYAKALLSLGIDTRQFEQIGEQLRRVAELFEAHRGLRTTLENPSYALDRRKAILVELSSRLELLAPLRRFLLLLVDRQRIAYLDDIAHAYTALADVHAGRVRASVAAARDLDPATIGRLRQALEQKTSKSVELTTRTDPDLIAGIVTTVGSTVYDGSLRARLNQLKSTLLDDGVDAGLAPTPESSPT
jgi:F-type H+-transporting ATPase subunit delta